MVLSSRDSQVPDLTQVIMKDQGQQEPQEMFSALLLSAKPRPAKMLDQQVFSYASKLRSSLHHCLFRPVYTSFKHQVSSVGFALACVLPQHMSLSQLTSLCQSAQVCRSGKKLQHTIRRFLVHFSLWNPDKCHSTMQCKADQYSCVVSKESFIMCPFTYLL